MCAVVYGDASVQDAKRRADIGEVVTIHRMYEWVLGFMEGHVSLFEGSRHTPLPTKASSRRAFNSERSWVLARTSWGIASDWRCLRTCRHPM